MMIAVLGATGGCGRLVVSAALARGYRVQALVRDPEKLKKQLAETGVVAENVVVVVGDASDAASIRRAVEGVDVVVSCIGATSRTDTVMSRTASNLLAILNEKNSALRLVMMTAIGCGGTSPITKVACKMMFGSVMMEDMDLADRLIRDDARFPFVVVRPPRIDSGEGAGNYVATVEYPRLCPLACGIKYADVAMFIVDAVETKKWDGNAVQLYSA
jgi:putative NADH-flavin reductase